MLPRIKSYVVHMTDISYDNDLGLFIEPFSYKLKQLCCTRYSNQVHVYDEIYKITQKLLSREKYLLCNNNKPEKGTRWH